jgi:hypothetical protein
MAIDCLQGDVPQTSERRKPGKSAVGNGTHLEFGSSPKSVTAVEPASTQRVTGHAIFLQHGGSFGVIYALDAPRSEPGAPRSGPERSQEVYEWPGNVRELQNVIERGVIKTTGSVLSRQTAEHLAISGLLSAAAEPESIETMADAERAHITAALRATNWVVSGPNGAAAQLGLPRTTLLSRMQRLGIPGRV